jgi:hypothetical protein
MRGGGTVGVGVIGAGVISSQYLRNLTAFPDLDVLFVADIDEDRAHDRAAAFGVRGSGSVGELLAHDGIEIVVNLTIPRAHVDVALRALAAGKHVWNEKPIALDRKERPGTARCRQRRGPAHRDPGHVPRPGHPDGAAADRVRCDRHAAHRADPHAGALSGVVASRPAFRSRVCPAVRAGLARVIAVGRRRRPCAPSAPDPCRSAVPRHCRDARESPIRRRIAGRGTPRRAPGRWSLILAPDNRKLR